MKGAFQMSLGLIVAVVFAVVLLSLAIVWVQGLVGDISGLTQDLTQRARSEILKSFEQSNNNFDIWPNQYVLKPGEPLKMSTGLKNDASDGKTHTMVINIIPVSASACGADFTNCIGPDGGSMKDYMQRWVTFNSNPENALINSVLFKDFVITPPGNVIKGSYLFSVVPCYDNPAGSIPISAQCTPISANVWSNSRAITIIIN